MWLFYSPKCVVSDLTMDHLLLRTLIMINDESFTYDCDCSGTGDSKASVTRDRHTTSSSARGTHYAVVVTTNIYYVPTIISRITALARGSVRLSVAYGLLTQ